MHAADVQRDRVDVLVVGGGINGVAIARDAAGRGLSVLLCEQDDLAAHTSSASSKLIHGGLRYLEQYEFALVGKALAERDVVLNSAPHIVRPLRFVLPHEPHLRPEWMIRAALLLYDNLGRRRAHSLINSRRVDLREHVAGAALKPQFDKGFIYSDAWCDDARLVVLNALDAAARGAQILTRTRCAQVRRASASWSAQLRDAAGDVRQIQARALVNATGPWAASFLDDVANVSHRHALRLVKGSHIVVNKLYDHAYAYTFQQSDRRIVFAIPFDHDYTLIGTTDTEFGGAPETVRIDAAEIEYLCAAASRYFARSVTPADVIWSYSGVRPLLEDESSAAADVTRDYLLDFDNAGAPLLSVFGGKITTFRRLAESALEKLAPHLPRATGEAAGWTGKHKLPGGDFPVDGFAATVEAVRRDYPFLGADHARRLVRAYGTKARDLLGSARNSADLGRVVGADLTEAEIRYLARAEWACHAEDVVWRRTKLGLRMTPAEIAEVEHVLHGEPVAA